MAVTAQELRDGAKKAQERVGGSEVERRSAASRSYYAAFHRCVHIAIQRAIFTDVRGSHAQIIEARTRSRNTKIKSIGWRLEQCRETRVKADYHLALDFTEEDAQLMTEQCAKIWSSTKGTEEAQGT